MAAPSSLAMPSSGESTRSASRFQRDTEMQDCNTPEESELKPKIQMYLKSRGAVRTRNTSRFTLCSATSLMQNSVVLQCELFMLRFREAGVQIGCELRALGPDPGVGGSPLRSVASVRRKSVVRFGAVAGESPAFYFPLCPARSPSPLRSGITPRGRLSSRFRGGMEGGVSLLFVLSPRILSTHVAAHLFRDNAANLGVFAAGHPLHRGASGLADAETLKAGPFLPTKLLVVKATAAVRSDRRHQSTSSDCKYLYLTFVPIPRDIVDLNEFVFTTEAGLARFCFVFKPFNLQLRAGEDGGERRKSFQCRRRAEGGGGRGMCVSSCLNPELAARLTAVARLSHQLQDVNNSNNSNNNTHQPQDSRQAHPLRVFRAGSAGKRQKQFLGN
ncbi:unnamed protein product [Polarella glacialis]|uniref:Uncharacterized protein n=1 Tax=Polarella glacialis TaxID=89957 RepID=A0A813EPQ7_POLGL|nr:unnamed protein product [Polarella glacialis]